MYALLVAVAVFSGTWTLIVSLLYGVYFAMPPRIWVRRRGAAA